MENLRVITRTFSAYSYSFGVPVVEKTEWRTRNGCSDHQAGNELSLSSRPGLPRSHRGAPSLRALAVVASNQAPVWGRERLPPFKLPRAARRFVLRRVSRYAECCAQCERLVL